MSNKSPWLLAAISLFAGTAAADAIRYRAQPDGTRAWLIDRGGLFVEEPRKARRAVDLPDWQWAGERYACAPDIAFGPRGEVVVTSNVLPVLWKIDPATLAVSVHRLQLDADTDKDVGFSALVYSERNGAYFAVSELQGSLWRIDPLLRRAQKVSIEGHARGACAVSVQRQERASMFSRLCLHGRDGSSIVHLAADQRSAYLQTTGCYANPYTVIGGMR